MKKLMFALVAAGAAAVMGEEIASQNVVGYTSFTAESGKYYIIGSQFDSTDGGNKDIQDLISGLEANDGGTVEDPTSYGTAPQILMIQANGKTYDEYRFIKDAYSEDENGDEIQIPAWTFDGSDEPCTLSVPPTLSFWFKQSTGANRTITVSGQVGEAGDFTTVANTFKLAAIPYPNDISVNDSRIDWGIDAEDGGTVEDPVSYGTAPQILVLQADGKTYKEFRYIKDAYSEDENGDEIQIPAWTYEGSDEPSDRSLEAGRGFWIKTPKAATVEFNK